MKAIATSTNSVYFESKKMETGPRVHATVE